MSSAITMSVCPIKSVTLQVYSPLAFLVTLTIVNSLVLSPITIPLLLVRENGTSQEKIRPNPVALQAKVALRPVVTLMSGISCMVGGGTTRYKEIVALTM